MNAEEFDKLLDERLENALTGERLEAFERALEEEPARAEELEAHESLFEMLGAMEPAPPAPASLRRGVMDRVRAECAAASSPSRPSFLETFRGLFARFELKALATACLAATVLVSYYAWTPGTTPQNKLGRSREIASVADEHKNETASSDSPLGAIVSEKEAVRPKSVEEKLAEEIAWDTANGPADNEFIELRHVVLESGDPVGETDERLLAEKRGTGNLLAMESGETSIGTVALTVSDGDGMGRGSFAWFGGNGDGLAELPGGLTSHSMLALVYVVEEDYITTLPAVAASTMPEKKIAMTLDHADSDNVSEGFFERYARERGRDDTNGTITPTPKKSDPQKPDEKMSETKSVESLTRPLSTISRPTATPAPTRKPAPEGRLYSAGSGLQSPKKPETPPQTTASRAKQIFSPSMTLHVYAPARESEEDAKRKGLREMTRSSYARAPLDVKEFERRLREAGIEVRRVAPAAAAPTTKITSAARPRPEAILLCAARGHDKQWLLRELEKWGLSPQNRSAWGRYKVAGEKKEKTTTDTNSIFLFRVDFFQTP